MHINRRARTASPARTRESPRGTGVIEMNVTEKNVPHILSRKAGFAKIGNHIVESRFRSGIEQRDTVVGFERGRGHNSGVPKLPGI
jgi:hypothetical protein